MSDQVELNVASKESVALELTKFIAHKEGLSSTDQEYRKKFLDLYNECLQATNNNRAL